MRDLLDGDYFPYGSQYYRDHPALAIWNVGSEPELTQIMSELRRWADDAAPRPTTPGT